MNSETQDAGHIDFAAWLIRLVTWDGVMPVCMIAIPYVTRLLFPEGAFVFVAVPIRRLRIWPLTLETAPAIW
jgi:hypothetical protein